MRSAKRAERLMAAVSFALLVATSGCNRLSATVTGTVRIDGEPLKVTADQRGMVVFRPVAGGATCTSLIGSEGEFRIATGSTDGLSPGDYLVSVRLIERVAGAAGEGPSGIAITPAVYADPLTSGLVYSVSSGSNRIEIDLDSDAGPAVVPVIVEPAGGAAEGTDDAAQLEAAGAVMTDASSETPPGPEVDPAATLDQPLPKEPVLEDVVDGQE